MQEMNVEITLYAPKDDVRAITNIKALRTALGIGLKEAKDLYTAALQGIVIYITAEQYGRIICACFASETCTIYERINRVDLVRRDYQFDFTKP